MELISAVCPQCSGNLKINKSLEAITCTYCGANIVVKEVADEVRYQVGNLMTLAEESEKAGNFSSAYDLYSRVLEFDPSNSDAWFGKGTAAGRCSTLLSDGFSELINCYENSFKFSSDQTTLESLKKLGAIKSFNIAQDFFSMSLEHTLRFIGVREAQYEHADRCKRIIELCEYSKGLDSELEKVNEFMVDISNRCIKISYLGDASRNYFKQVKSKYEVQVLTSTKKENSAVEFGGGVAGVVFIIGVLYVGYKISKSLFEITNPLRLIFSTIGTAIGIGLVAVLIIAKVYLAYAGKDKAKEA